MQLDLEGQTFTWLTVIELAYEEFREFPSSRSKRIYFWKCTCQCGNMTTVRQEYLLNGDTKSCGCYAGRSQPQTLKNKVAYNYKNNAKMRGLIIELSNERIIELCEQDCFYCGCPPEESNCMVDGKNPYRYRYNGIDRKHNDLGYIEGNVVPCCKVCNRAKYDLTYDEWTKWLDRIKSN